MAFDVRDVGYFLEAARHRHMGRAASALGLSQPALTKAIARLERELGVRLFDRGSRGLQPTAAGEAFLVKAEHIRNAYEDAMRMAGDLRVGAAGRLRVGASAIAASRFVTPALSGLLRQRPNARISLSVRLSTDVLRGLRAGEFDVAVIPDPPADAGGLAVVPLGEDEMVVVAAQRHPLFRQALHGLRALTAYSWILPRELTPARLWLSEAFRREGLAPPAPVVEVDYGATEAVALAACTELLTLAALPPGRRPWPVPVRRIDLPGLGLRRRFAALVRGDAYRSPLADALLDALEASARASAR